MAASKKPNGHEHDTIEGQKFIRHHSYIADLSFETFNVNQHLLSGSGEMAVSYGFDVEAHEVGEHAFIVGLKLRVKVEAGPEDLVMLIELRYEGLIEVAPTTPEDDIRRILLVDAVEMLYPYAVMVIANLTRESGFSPIVLEKLDFAGMFTQRAAEAELN